jgi:hypothetical protein
MEREDALCVRARGLNAPNRSEGYWSFSRVQASSFSRPSNGWT